MLRISYIEHKKNEEVLNMMKTKRSLLKAKYFGHMVRQNGLQRLLSEGKYTENGKGKAKNYVGK